MSDVYALGQPVRLSTAVADILGNDADPTTLSLSWVDQAGTTLTKTWPSPADLTRDSLGNFHYDLTPAAAGHYRYVWTATGTAAGVGPDPGPGVFDVLDPLAAGSERIVSTADAKAYLRLQGTADDALLDRIVGWASARIIQEVGSVVSTIRSERVTVRAGRPMRLSHPPVRSVISVTVADTWSSAVPVADLVVTNALAGLVGSQSSVLSGVYDVTYRAGYDTVPVGVDGAVLSLVQHWWNQSQSHGSSTYGDTGFTPGDWKCLPNAVMNKLAVVPRSPKVA